MEREILLPSNRIVCILTDGSVGHGSSSLYVTLSNFSKLSYQGFSRLNNSCFESSDSTNSDGDCFHTI